MEVNIILNNSEQTLHSEHLRELKTELEKELGKQNVELKVLQPKPGEMGGGLTNILTAAIDKENVAKIKNFISKFTSLKKVELTLVNAKGEKLQLNAAMDKEVMYMLLNGFFERSLIDLPTKDQEPKETTKRKNNTKKKRKRKTKKVTTKKNKAKLLPKKTTKSTKSTKIVSSKKNS